MANMIPNLSEIQLSNIKSRGEIKVYKSLRDGLSKDFTVFFQVGWILKNENENAKDGETDFIICHPIYGYICLEVKGGGISFDSTTNEWFSIDRNEQKNKIKDPIQQALRAKYSVRSKLYENGKWRELNLLKANCGHAVFFPDIGDAKPLARTDMPINIIGTLDNLLNMGKWVEGCFTWWNSNIQNSILLGQKGIEIFCETFANSFTVKPLVSSWLKEEEDKRLQLTNEQIRILDILRAHRRVAVSGGAGTGKTVLAVEKAMRLANEGFRTLLTCYNRPLADHLANVCKGVAGLSVMSFHQLCIRKIEDANERSCRDLLKEAKVTYPGENEFDIQMPNALAYSVEISPERFDAIVCDEGQDFREEFWFPLELLLTDYETSPFYIFYDDNQNLYSRVSTFPISQSTFPLTINCRNTVQIHNASYRFYEGELVNPSSLSGEDVQFEIANSLDKQAVKINARILQLLIQEKVQTSNISILIVDAKHKTDYFDALERLPLPANIKFSHEPRDDNSILITTVNKFKGLEAEIIFLWGIDYLDFSQIREQMYVGLSRAKSLLYVVGNKELQERFI